MREDLSATALRLANDLRTIPYAADQGCSLRENAATTLRALAAANDALRAERDAARAERSAMHRRVTEAEGLHFNHRMKDERDAALRDLKAAREALRRIAETRWDMGAAEACLVTIQTDARAALEPGA